jgi:hypothetical protein
MKTFKEYLQENNLIEKVLSIGLNPEHEKHRETHRKEIHDIIHKSYKSVDGYAGHKSGSSEESKAIHHDITHSDIKVVKRGDHISSVNLYKKSHGRKSIASGTDGTEQGKKDFVKTKTDDHTQKRAWGEVSGKVAHMHSKIGTPDIPSKHAAKLLGKDVKHHPDGKHYDRKIGNTIHTKKMVGHTKPE